MIEVVSKPVKLLCLVVFLFLIFEQNYALASFGITPPYVRNTSLTRNSTYEQQILLVRGNPDVPLKALITIDAPEIQDWIQIEQGNEIALPRGEQKIPMLVKIKVPAEADFKDYKGAIRIKTVPDNNQVGSGAVNISLGAQVDINLTVIDREIKDFRVRKISVSDLNEGHKVAWLYFPGKINFKMMIENTGNVDIAPSKVEFRIFDFNGAVLLEETHELGRIKKIAPFATDEVVASLPTRLPAGSYLARYKIYNDETVKQEGEVNLSILKYGTSQEAGFGFSGLSLPHKISVLLPIFVLVIVILYLWHSRKSKHKHSK